MNESFDSTVGSTERRRAVDQVAGEVFYALVIEYHRDTTRSDEHGHPVPLDQCPRVVHLELPTAVEHDGERSEWRPVAERLGYGRNCPLCLSNPFRERTI